MSKKKLPKFNTNEISHKVFKPRAAAILKWNGEILKKLNIQVRHAVSIREILP
jgi:hypothetical protein